MEPAPFSSRLPWTNVLLTGSTGFVGSFLLRGLLDHTDAVIYCVSRGDSDRAVEARIRTAFDGYGLGLADPDRIRPIAGDLTRPELGMPEAVFDDLADRIDAVVHAGAQVNLVMPAERLAAANVSGTREVLRMAQRRGAATHLISTVEVFGPGAGVVDEKTAATGCFAPRSGYGRTKHAAEAAAWQAASRGLPVTVHRLDRVSGDSRSGVAQPGADDLWQLLRASLAVGMLPDTPLPISLTPVDFAASAVLALASTEAAAGSTFHLSHPNPVRVAELAEALRRGGWPVELVPSDHWHAALQELGSRPGGDPMPRLLSSMADRIWGGTPQISTPHTTAALARTGLRYPPVGAELLDRYLRQLRATGFLPAPAPSRHPAPMESPALETGAGGPDIDVVAPLLAAFTEVIGVPPVNGLATRPEQVEQWDSLSHVWLFTKVESVFGCKLPAELMLIGPELGAFADAVAQVPAGEPRPTPVA
ncbi:thioester reductase domain-containing protein [Nocardia wallacei]|uniref:thioester reductase domain-containing protein n=1 Tax=Nocardia wallacei TaxID=480035 RepID=UPI002453BBF6|nr:thioester reductase domain-containing protein [Nocardia wallacei]